MRRLLATLTAVLLAATMLAGCTVETQSCKSGVCTLKLKGKDASGKLGGDGGSTITLLSTTDKTAKVKIDDNTGQLTLGQPISLTNATLELTEVKGENSVVIKVVSDEAKRSNTN